MVKDIKLVSGKNKAMVTILISDKFELKAKSMNWV